MSNELQKAIDRLKENIEYLEEVIDDCSTRSMVRDEALKDIPAFTTALAALLDALKRAEGCEYCAANDWERKPLAKWETYFDNWIKEDHETSIGDYDGEYFVSSSPGEGPGFDIKYCPMCGRKFGD